MRQFVPMTDEMLDNLHPLPGPLVPYRAGIACWHALAEDGVYHFSDCESPSSMGGLAAMKPVGEFASPHAAALPTRELCGAEG